MSADRLDLAEKVAIVTGSTKGMGQTIAEEIVARGGRVVITSRNAAEASETANRLNARQGRTVAVAQAGDQSSLADQEAIVAKAMSAFGSLTTLVCSPSIQPWFGSSLETPEEEIDQQYLLIFKSRFRLSRLCIPHMQKARNGSVVYIGSGSAFESTDERNTYSCMRAAEVQMMRNFAAEFGRDNIRFNLIAPAMIDTSGATSMFADKAVVADLRAKLPMGRSGTRAEIAAAALFLASDASSFTTGAVLPVDGGRSLHVRPTKFAAAFASEQAARMAGTKAS